MQDLQSHNFIWIILAHKQVNYKLEIINLDIKLQNTLNVTRINHDVE